MTCKNCNEEMTKIRDNGRIGYVCLHCGGSFVPQQTDTEQSDDQYKNLVERDTRL